MRRMKEADVDSVLGIEVAVQAYPWSRGNFIDALNQSYVCCVDEDNSVIRGYGILMPGVAEAELLNIGVAAEWQRRGLGRMILNEMFRVARTIKMRRVYLEVRPSNSAAISLYGTAGFRVIGVRRGYYQSTEGGEDALVMACDLKDEEDG